MQVTDIAPIETLIDDPNPSVRCGIAERRDLTPDQLHQLATDTQFRIRRCVASNMSTPTELLEVLALDPNEYVVSAVSWTRRVSVDAFRPSWLLAKFAATYKKLARRSANPDLFAELATSWTGSTKALLLAIADTCELLV